MENILDLSVLAFRSEALDRLSAQLHESRAATKRGAETAMPVALAGLAEHARSPRNAEELLSTLRSGEYPRVDSEGVARAAGDAVTTQQIARSGAGFLDSVFGDKLARLVDAVSEPSGLSRSSATTLLGLAMPVVLEEVGRETRARDLDAPGLSRLLAREEQRVAGLLPASFSAVLGGPLPSAGERAAASLPQRRRRFGWAWLILALLAALVLLVAALRSARSPLSAPELGLVPEPAGHGSALSASAAELSAYLSSGEPAPRRFALEGAGDEIGSSRVRSPTLDAVAAVLQEHPAARIRVEVHGDLQGAGDDGQTPAGRRALGVKSYLIGKGVAADRIETSAGILDQRFAGRVQEPRVDLVVIQR